MDTSLLSHHMDARNLAHSCIPAPLRAGGVATPMAMAMPAHTTGAAQQY